MAENITVESAEIYFSSIQIGTRIAYVVVEWSVPVFMVGIPPVVLTDANDTEYLPEWSAPHITEESKITAFSRFRYNSVPQFFPFEISVPASVEGIEDASGNTTAAATVPAPVPPPP